VKKAIRKTLIVSAKSPCTMPQNTLVFAGQPAFWRMRRQQNRGRSFDYDVLTQGLGTILDARHLVLIARGFGKASAVHQLVEGPVSAFCPASVLQLHPHATVLLDDDAASQLRLADYYRETYANKPPWQGL
jgi:hypothetical protein